MSKLDIAKDRWKAEVEEEEIELIVCGIVPYIAHEMAINIISSRRRDKHADKSGR